MDKQANREIDWQIDKQTSGQENEWIAMNTQRTKQEKTINQFQNIFARLTWKHEEGIQKTGKKWPIFKEWYWFCWL